MQFSDTHCRTWFYYLTVVLFCFQLKHLEVFRLKSIRREIKETEEITAQRVVKRAAAKEQKMYQPAMLSGYKFEQPVNTLFVQWGTE